MWYINAEIVGLKVSVIQLLQTPQQVPNMKVFILTVFVTMATARSTYPANSYKTPSYPAYAPPSYPAYAPSSYPVPAYEKTETYKAEPYSFSWDVKDEYYNDYSHTQSSDGKVVTGSYRIELPDGRGQTVTYRADSNGYVADVKYDGEAKYPPPDYKPAEYAAPVYKDSTYRVPAYKSPVYKTSAGY